MYYFVYFLVFISLVGCSGNFLTDESQNRSKIYEGYSFNAYLNGEKIAISKALLYQNQLGTQDEEAIENGLSYTEALKKAKIEMIKQGKSPALWSAFILNGEG